MNIIPTSQVVSESDPRKIGKEDLVNWGGGGGGVRCKLHMFIFSEPCKACRVFLLNQTHAQGFFISRLVFISF